MLRRIVLYGAITLTLIIMLTITYNIYYNSNHDYYDYRTRQKLQMIADVSRAVPYSEVERGDVGTLPAFLQTLSRASHEELSYLGTDAFGEPFGYRASRDGNAIVVVITTERAGTIQHRLELVFAPPIHPNAPSVTVHRSW